MIELKLIEDENFNHYKNVGMLIAFPHCDWKCLKELGLDKSICQNCQLSKNKSEFYTEKDLFLRYTNNKLTNCIIIAGLEPLKDFNNVISIIKYFRSVNCNDIFIIYTGYYPEEIEVEIEILKQFKNIIVKFGRFIPNSENKLDKVLGINLVNPEQFARKIS